MSTGIDYGKGTTNIDTKTGIRYGVISVHDITQAWCDSSEPNYGEPTCGNCGKEVLDLDNSDVVFCPQCGKDVAKSVSIGLKRCQYCGEEIDTSDTDIIRFCPLCGDENEYQDWYPDEPLGHELIEDIDDGLYKAIDCLDSNVMVLESPFYTFACFCSPCVPGAGDINSPDPDGVKAYCFGHDFFDDGVAPYPVYRVSDDSLVIAPDKHRVLHHSAFTRYEIYADETIKGKCKWCGNASAPLLYNSPDDSNGARDSQLGFFCDVDCLQAYTGNALDA